MGIFVRLSAQVQHTQAGLLGRERINGVIEVILIALQDGGIDALRASSGALRWHRAMSS